jgi:hypothetical protein
VQLTSIATGQDGAGCGGQVGREPRYGRRWCFVSWPDGTNTTWFPDNGELRVWCKGYDIDRDLTPQQGNGGETLNVRFVARQ